MKFLLTSLLLVLGLAAAVSEATLSPFLVSHLWNSFKKTHQKQYLSDEHESERHGIFAANLERIERHNGEFARGLHTFTLGVNAFADWTVDEFRWHILGSGGFNASMAHSKSASVATFQALPKEIVKLADQVDWREQGAVTPVKVYRKALLEREEAYVICV